METKKRDVVKTSILLPKEVAAKLDEVARKYMTTKSSIVLLALQKYLMEIEKEYKHLMGLDKRDNDV